MLDAALYIGHVMHHRLRPKRHRFIYRFATLLIDIDRLTDIENRLRFLSVGRFNLFSVNIRDHGPRDGTPLRPWVEAELEAAGLASSPARILLLSMPRFLGYVFNPLSIYYCYDDDERLFAIIYEVKNTFGEQHPYVLAMPDKPTKSGRYHQSCDKNFYVSPFIEAEANYRFSLNEPDNNLDVRISEYVESGALLVATMQGKRRALTDRQLIIQALFYPFLPQMVMASIHYQALKLWLKGISLQPREAGRGRSGFHPPEEAKSR